MCEIAIWHFCYATIQHRLALQRELLSLFARSGTAQNKISPFFAETRLCQHFATQQRANSRHCSQQQKKRKDVEAPAPVKCYGPPAAGMGHGRDRTQTRTEGTPPRPPDNAARAQRLRSGAWALLRAKATHSQGSASGIDVALISNPRTGSQSAGS